MLIFLGLVFAAIGLLMLLVPDLAWWFTERSNAAKGQVSERSDAWERGRVVSGVLMLLIALVVFIAA